MSPAADSTSSPTACFAVEARADPGVMPPGELFAAAEETARRIAVLPAAQVSDLKRVLNRACHLDLEAALALETEATVRGFLDPETRARVARFGK